MKENQNKQDPVRRLTADEIDVRVAQTTDYNGEVKASLLLYKDARVDMRVLDELYGPMNWKRSHQLIGDRLYCTIEVWDSEKGCWIAKQDVGTESNTEPEKGQASDAFKRAGFNWGIGRELYTAPNISIPLNEKEFSRQQGNGKIRVWAQFRVARIGYDDAGNINDLSIVDRFNNERFCHPRKNAQNGARNYTPAPTPTPGVQPQNSAPFGGNTATQAPAPATRRLVTLADVQAGKARALVTALSKRDYDDLRDWNEGLEELRAKYDYATGALEEIQQLAVEERNARLDSAIKNVQIPA